MVEGFKGNVLQSTTRNRHTRISRQRTNNACLFTKSESIIEILRSLSLGVSEPAFERGSRFQTLELYTSSDNEENQKDPPTTNSTKTVKKPDVQSTCQGNFESACSICIN